MAVQGQPKIAEWDFDVASVQALEAGGLAPNHIINAPNQFQLITSLSNTGILSDFIHGRTGTIRYRAERLEDNSVVTLASTSFTVPAAVNFDVPSTPFTSGPGGNLPVGTYMVTAIVSMDNVPERRHVAGFDQTVIRVIQ